ncbi:bifunctional metallophosphatase/5'-nucleotidase [Glycomyces albidus]|uniref:Bifunctional metallophosphatase/5'-nucleotidase n=1 Tax=Glycomyces albidus TaxID=2656774 RepID=A0A6L5GEH3_9ACTN|nr:5'-nucleotidase C-terminal domain-containing protein [Glycomyces albidus]MQM28100.1 bifunctional metallophosphatase/5'-nucleotidase [Glycomyces albidus]
MPVNRRTLLGASAAAGAAAAALTASPASAKQSAKRYSFTVMGTTDLHGNVFNWDYFKDAAYTDAAGNTRGLARVATLVEQVRDEVGRENTILIDAGDTIQGTPLAYYYARVDPIAQDGGPVHPMAQAMNAIDYDAAALGNHEFNYGLDTLRKFESQLHFPLLGANVIDTETGRPAFPPYHITRLRTPRGRDVKVGILGLCTPGVTIWDKAIVDGVLEFPGLETEAAHWVAHLREEEGVDVVVISAHSGTSGTSAYDTSTGLGIENASKIVAETVPGIDAILVGHAHIEIPETRVAGPDGGEVVLSEPLCYGQRLTRFDFDLVWKHGKWTVESIGASVLNSNTVEEHERITEILTDEHGEVVAYVNQVVGQAAIDLDTAEARYKDEPIIDLITKVQEDTVKAALAGTEHADLPVVSQASPFSRTSLIPAGDVRIKDLSSLYIYDNTLVAKLLTGAQIRDYLEYSAAYFVQTAAGAAMDPDAITNAGNRPDYNYDYVSGFTYEIDIAKPAGSRIANLRHAGADVDDAQRFVFAVNNYRANGGGNFPHVAAAQELWSESIEIRTRIIEWVTAKGALDPAEFASVDWVLTRDGVPVF